MKLSAYYKKKREIVILSPELTPERHQQFFIRKDYNDGIFPKIPTENSNLNYGGYAFTNGIYVPMDYNIEVCQPDTSIYLKMENKILEKGNKREGKKIFNNLTEGEHCRLSLDGKTIWKDYPRQFKYLKTAKNLFFHDYDLGKIQGAPEEILSILTRARTDGCATRVGMKFPVTITKGEELMKWIKIRPNSTFFYLRFDGVIEDEHVEPFIGSCKERTIYRDLEYYITATSEDQEEFVQKYLQKIYRQVVLSRSYRVFFTLKYEENFFLDKRWESVIQLINFYHNSLKSLDQSIYYKKINYDTLYDFAKSTYDILPYQYKSGMNKKKIREVFRFVAENHQELFNDFYTYNIKNMEEKNV